MLADLGADVVRVESPSGNGTLAYRSRTAPDICCMYLNLTGNELSRISISNRSLARTASIPIARCACGTDRNGASKGDTGQY